MKTYKLLSISLLNTFVSIIILSFFLNDFFKINQLEYSIQYFLTYTLYLIPVLYFLRLVLTVPVYYIIKMASTFASKAWFYFIELLLFLFVIGEIKLYTGQGLHVYDKIVFKTLMNSNFNKEVGIGIDSIMVLLGIISSFIFMQLLFKKIVFVKNKRPIFISIGVILPCFTWVTLSYIPAHGNISNIFPFYSILKGTPKQNKMSLVYSYNEKIKFNTTPNILFIMAESLRSDFLTKQRMPKLTKLFKSENCSSLTKAYSGGHTTEYGVFTSLYGVYGYHFDNFKREQKSSYGLELLVQNNYKLIGGSASGLNNWNDSSFMFKKFRPYKEFLTGKVYLDDKNLKDWLLKKISLVDSPSFIFSFFNSTHHSYYFSDKFKVHTPIADEVYNHLYTKGSKEDFRKKLFNRYKNSALYLDDMVTNYIIKAKKHLGEDTIVVFTGDHGEEFWEEGLHGHGKTNYINQRINVPLVICSGKTKTILENFGGHADIFPTLVDLLSRKTSQAFNGESLKTTRKIPYLVITAPQFPYGRNKVGLIHEKYKFWMKRSGNSMHELYKYRSTDLNDNTIKNGEDINTLNNILQDFSSTGYRFLKEK